MSTLTPSVDCLGAALRALRQTHAHDPERGQDIARRQVPSRCHPQLTEEGLPQEDLQPLIDLETSLRQRKAQSQGAGAANRRKRKPPSDKLVARIAAVIDLLVKGGSDDSEAAQLIMRKLIAAGVPAPSRAAMRGAGSASCRGGPISAKASAQPKPGKNTRILCASSKPSRPTSGSSACSTSSFGTAG